MTDYLKKGVLVTDRTRGSFSNKMPNFFTKFDKSQLKFKHFCGKQCIFFNTLLILVLSLAMVCKCLRR